MSKKKEDFEFYDDEYFDKARERVQRLRELEERELYLRKEKSRLIKEKPWYKKPQNIIAIIAILLPIVASILISAYSEDKKEITVEYFEIEPLIVESSNFGNKVSIKYDSTEIKNISRVKFRIFNSGDLDIEKNDFIDGSLNISFSPKVKNDVINIYKVLKIDDAGQQNSILEFEPFNKKSSFSYLPSLMNKGDVVIIDAYLIDPSNYSITIKGKIRNGEIKGPEFSKADKLELGYKTFILSTHSFFNNKWLLTTVFALIFMLTGISSIYIFVTSTEEENPKTLMIAMGITIGLISILSVTIIISTLIYI